MGCTLPSLASSGPLNVSAIPASAMSGWSNPANSTEQGQTDLMAGMENCPHHSASNAPAKHNDRKPVRGGGMSCCPVEVTFGSKPDIATLQIFPARAFVLQSHLNLETVRFHHAVQFLPSVWHSGRDTLLETHLLRV